MKIALYIEDGLEQIVLTPTSETEKAILEKIHDGSREMSIKRGEFYGCRGGWMRQKKRYHSPYGSDEPNDESTMIVLRERVSEPDRPEVAPSYVPQYCTTDCDRFCAVAVVRCSTCPVGTAHSEGATQP